MKAVKPTTSDLRQSRKTLELKDNALTWTRSALFLLGCVDRTYSDVMWVRCSMLPFTVTLCGCVVPCCYLPWRYMGALFHAAIYRDVMWVLCSMLPFTKLGDILHMILPNFSSGSFLHLASVIIEPAWKKRKKRLTKVFRDWLSLVSSSWGRKHPRQHCHLSMYLHLIRQSNTGAAVSTPRTCVRVIRFI
jgi:hypothetical protein